CWPPPWTDPRTRRTGPHRPSRGPPSLPFSSAPTSASASPPCYCRAVLPRRAIFDLDGTLADTMPVHFRAWQLVAPRFGLVFPEPRFYALGGVPTHRIAATLIAEQGLVGVDPAEVTAAKERAFLERRHEIGPVPAVVEIAR